MMPTQETCLTPNAYNALDIEVDMQEQTIPTSEIREKTGGTIQTNDGCVTRTFALHLLQKECYIHKN